MEEKQEVQKTRTRKGPRKNPCGKRYPYEERLKAVKLCLEEGFDFPLVCQEMGMSDTALRNWVALYREEGEAGLAWSHPPRGVSAASAVQRKIVELKRANPWWGVKRIALVMKRWFLLPASPSTVRKTLAAESLMSPPNGKKPRNLSKPRFFERATPNQMWQSDIFTFRLGGRYAHLIAFMDDYSRFIVGAGLFRTASGMATLEVFRKAAGEYNPPKEMLTDRGPQYVNWRGKSRFAAEMEKERIHHIKSRPGHPQTLGKVERFWSSIWQEFLVRAQFESFESAQERIARWIQYYNHKRPHQGIEGLCPADRFFEIAHELRQTIEKGVAANVLELALRGEPRAPFYMVGRMEGQSVVLRAEKGKLKLTVEDPQQNQTQELVYDLKKGNGNEPLNGKAIPQTDGAASTQRAGEVPGGADAVDGESPAERSVPGAESELHGAQPLAGAGAGGYAPGALHPGGLGGGASALAAAAVAPGEAAADGGGAETGKTAGSDAGGGACGPQNGELKSEITNENGKFVSEGGGRTAPPEGIACASAHAPDPASAGGNQNGHPSGGGTGGITADVPPVGEAGAARLASGDGGTGTGATAHAGGSAEGGPDAGKPEAPARSGGDGTDRGAEGIALAPAGGGIGAGGARAV
jgi:transposase InsO family protein